jgi:hypothetical protein
VLGETEAVDLLIEEPIDFDALGPALLAMPEVILIDALDEALSYDARPSLVDVLHKATDTAGELPERVRFCSRAASTRRLT